MLSLLLRTFASVCVLTALARVSAVTTTTVVGVAGRRVMLPCRSEEVSQRGAEVCWGKGEPSLFNCHNTVINTAGAQISYRRSYRYSVSPSSFSLTIYNSRPSDSGFYHCRVQLPGPFNDQTSSVHLIIISPRSVASDDGDTENLNAPHTPTTQRRTEADAGSSTTHLTEGRGSDVSDTTEPMVAPVQAAVLQQQGNSLQTFVGNTVRLSFIIFIPAVLLTAAHRMWRHRQGPETDGRLNQSEEEEDASV
ncbi:hepatitis A virus cellular receptor 1 homolog [Xiphias gladius]|uniref:hepatitis A virus cellular receptor 1 homolog n=1 Tax=Xiphias gladius TaxID=8245 RepID=UPI001A982CDD|nr:hepatitis A virus cellular receptor 1 homolog [Xiphias gladius]